MDKGTGCTGIISIGRNFKAKHCNLILFAAIFPSASTFRWRNRKNKEGIKRPRNARGYFDFSFL